MDQHRKNLVYTGINYLMPILVVASIWLPIIRHYYAPGIDVTDDMLDLARRTPSDAVLEENKDFFPSLKPLKTWNTLSLKPKDSCGVRSRHLILLLGIGFSVFLWTTLKRLLHGLIIDLPFSKSPISCSAPIK